jgi:hypothetical protein
MEDTAVRGCMAGQVVNRRGNCGTEACQPTNTRIPSRMTDPAQTEE